MKILFFVTGYLFFGILSYFVGYMQGKKRAVLTDRDMSEKEYKYTAYIVVGVIFVIIGIAFSVSLRNLWEPNSDTRLMLGILTVLFLSGAFGGIIGNYYRKNKIGDNVKGADMLVSVLLGIGASLLVPVLLHILTSSLLYDIKAKPTKAFILVGFCLAASISAEGFIDRMLRNFNQMGENKNIKEEKLAVTKRSVYIDEDIEDI
jgi:peptidoglycan/LPS O-acetylase OafA/YrhL